MEGENPMNFKRIKAHLMGIGVVLVTLLAIMQIVGLFAIDKLMFHPEMVKDGYDATLPGYVDIGTNGTRIAALVRGPAKGRKAILYCHGNAEAYVIYISKYVDLLTKQSKPINVFLAGICYTCLRLNTGYFIR